MYKHVVEVKKASFETLIHQHHSVHVERISRLLDLIKVELTERPDTQDEVKDWFTKEIRFAKTKISENNLF